MKLFNKKAEQTKSLKKKQSSRIFSEKDALKNYGKFPEVYPQRIASVLKLHVDRQQINKNCT